MRRLALTLAAVAALSACASKQHDAPACRGEAFPLNAVEAAG